MTAATMPGRTEGADEAGLHLEVKDARVSYGESYVVDGASLSVKPGEVSCLIGRNGAGKTTLMKAIMGILPLRGGSIAAFGTEMRRWPPYRRARAGIGYVPQGRGIFPYLSVMENILVGLEPVKGKDTGQIDEAFELFPVLKEMGRRQAGLLSGGQQQQLAIARALVGRPKLLLLDEPTEGIQPSLVDEIQRVVASFKGTLSVLLIEQFLDFSMAVADRCFVMEQGRIVLEGAPDQLELDVLRRYLSV
jgi:urea transport system ATP-binding protein